MKNLRTVKELETVMRGKSKNQRIRLQHGRCRLLRKATGTKKQKGEDLIYDPKLRKEFAALKKKAAKKNP